MNKFDVYERLWREVGKEGSFIPDRVYTKEEYQLYKKLIMDNIKIATNIFLLYVK